MFNVRFRRVVCCVAAATMVAFVLPATAAAASVPVRASWRLIDLGLDDASVAWAINDRGHMVGTHGNGEVFLWRDGRVIDLGVTFTPVDINNRDEIVGAQSTMTGSVAVVWRDSVTSKLETPAGGSSYATAINDRGVIVGNTQASDNSPYRASFWRHSALFLVGDDDSMANDVNNRGQVVGQTGFFETFAAQWWRGREIQLTTEATAATAINEFGTVTGQHFGSWGNGAFVLQRGRFVHVPPPGDVNSYIDPLSINDRTQVVGMSTNGAFVWERGRTSYLPGRSTDTVAHDINDRGVIVGSSPASDGFGIRAVMWRR